MEDSLNDIEKEEVMQPLTLPRSQIHVVWCSNLELLCVLKITLLNMLLGRPSIGYTKQIKQGIHITAQGLWDKRVGKEGRTPREQEEIGFSPDSAT